jgi:copper chaperone CopZ
MNTNKQSFLTVCFLALILLFSCQGNKKAEAGKETFSASTVEISIKGMTCTGCEQTIQAGLTGLEGIESVKATFTDGKAIVVFDPSKTDTLKMKDVITGKGYAVNKFTMALQ